MTSPQDTVAHAHPLSYHFLLNYSRGLNYSIRVSQKSPKAGASPLPEREAPSQKLFFTGRVSGKETFEKP